MADSGIIVDLETGRWLAFVSNADGSRTNIGLYKELHEARAAIKRAGQNRSIRPTKFHKPEPAKNIFLANRDRKTIPGGKTPCTTCGHPIRSLIPGLCWKCREAEIKERLKRCVDEMGSTPRRL